MKFCFTTNLAFIPVLAFLSVCTAYIFEFKTQKLRRSDIVGLKKFAYYTKIAPEGPSATNPNNNKPDVDQYAYNAEINFEYDFLTFKKHIKSGGTLIASTWILTAASFATNADYAHVKLGSIPDGLGVSIKVPDGDFRIHPQFLEQHFENDIALIKIRAVPLSETIRPLALPFINEKTNFNYNAMDANITVFGEITNSRNETTTYQQLPGTYLRNCPQSVIKDVKENFLCVDLPNFYLNCEAHPLVVNLPGRDPVQIGICSFPVRKNIIGYTRVDLYLNWIAEVTGISLLRNSKEGKIQF